MFSICTELMTSRTLMYTRKNIISSVTKKGFSLQYKRPKRKWQCLNLQASNFHISSRLNQFSLPLCLGSSVCGYCIRKWWLNKTPKEKEMYILWYRSRRKLVHGAIGFAYIGLIIYCLTCVQRDPVLHKPRLILLDQSNQTENADIYFEIVVNNMANVVPLSDPMYLKVAAIIKKLIRCNKDVFQDTDWIITIIRRIFGIASIPNVLILPDRRIIILSDIFNLVKSNDQLMYVLAHEMSHEVLLHASAVLSMALVSNIVNAVFTCTFWIFFPTSVAALLCAAMYALSTVIICYYKRYNEAEADAVGLQLSAKSCIDVREISVFWEIMKTFEELSGQKRYRIPMFMQHPSVEEREKRFIEMIPKALELRKEAKCPSLPRRDPRDRLPMYKEDIKKYLHKHTHVLGMRL